MIEIKEIPVEINPGQLAVEARLPVEEAMDFIADTGPDETGLSGAGRFRSSFRSRAVFDWIEPARVFHGGINPGMDNWDTKMIVGLLAINNETGNLSDDSLKSSRAALLASSARLTLSESLEFLKYRIHLFLKPRKKVPGERLLPGCEDLPLEANQAILDYFRDQNIDLGLSLNQAGEIDPLKGLAFVYTTMTQTAIEANPCLSCQRKECPARQAALSS